MKVCLVLGAVGVWLGYPLADPFIGFLIILAIFGIVWQSAKAVFTRMLNGVEPGIVEDIMYAAAHVNAERDEHLPLFARQAERGILISVSRPAEPHEFDARLIVRVRDREDSIPFRMVEPVGHGHA